MTDSSTIVFSPFTRVEGDLRLAVDISDGAVRSARASGTLFRGFEEMLCGRDPSDAIVFLCRICGQCGAAHSAAAASALADAYGIEPPPNAYYCRNILQAAEIIISHLTQFYFAVGPDLARLPGGEALAGRFAMIRGDSFQKALRARHVLLALMGLVAGKWPNTLAIQPGGVTRTLGRSELARAEGIVADFRRFVEERFLGCALERWLEVRSLADVTAWMDEEKHRESDLGAFIGLALEAGLDHIGRGPGRFLSAGGLDFPDGETWLERGYYDGELHPLDMDAVSEDVSSAWYEVAAHRGSAPAAADSPPGEGSERTKAAREGFAQGAASNAPNKTGAYSWVKAPRYRGNSVEVGPMARMVVDRDPLAVDLMAGSGPSVFARDLLRLHEMVRLVGDTAGWLRRIDPEAPFCARHKVAVEGEGFGITEAPRGLLAHWVKIEQSLIRSYQVVTPTGWNLSPRDSAGNPGPLEEALVGTPARDRADQKSVVMVVASYDPCLYCSVH